MDGTHSWWRGKLLWCRQHALHLALNERLKVVKVSICRYQACNMYCMSGSAVNNALMLLLVHKKLCACASTAAK